MSIICQALVKWSKKKKNDIEWISNDVCGRSLRKHDARTDQWRSFSTVTRNWDFIAITVAVTIPLTGEPWRLLRGEGVVPNPRRRFRFDGRVRCRPLSVFFFAENRRSLGCRGVGKIGSAKGRRHRTAKDPFHERIWRPGNLTVS